MTLPTWKQAFVILGGSIVLAFSACFGFAVVANTRIPDDVLLVLLIILAVIAFAALFVGVPYSLVVMLIRLVRGSKSPPPETPDGQ